MTKSRKQNKNYEDYLRNERATRYLGKKYRTAHEWMPRLATEAPGLTSEEALVKVRDRLTKLRNSGRRIRKSRIAEHARRSCLKPDLQRALPVRPISPRERSFLSSAGSPGTIIVAYPRPAYPRPPDPPMTWETARGKVFEQLGKIQSNKIDGVAQASDFREYIWSSPSSSDTQAVHVFLPHGDSINDPYDFTGATGLQYLAEIEVQPGLLWDIGDQIGFAGVLQYTLPEAPWDGGVSWCVGQQFDIERITFNADEGYFSLVSIARQSPTGEGFPPSASFTQAFDLAYLFPTIWGGGEESSMGPFSATDMFDSGFPVKKGQKPRIYVGLSIYMSAVDGRTYLGDPNFAYHTCTEGPGLWYRFVRI